MVPSILDHSCEASRTYPSPLGRAPSASALLLPAARKVRDPQTAFSQTTASAYIKQPRCVLSPSPCVDLGCRCRASGFFILTVKPGTKHSDATKAQSPLSWSCQNGPQASLMPTNWWIKCLSHNLEVKICNVYNLDLQPFPPQNLYHFTQN